MHTVQQVDRSVYNVPMTARDTPEISSQSARERILRAAHDLFYRDGLRATGVDRVIAEAGVTKVTFYRHFPSKNELIRAFLEHRHARWLDWFGAALARHRAAQTPQDRARQALAPLQPTLEEWFCQPGFRGCAFINAVAELGGGLDDALPIAARHKQDMVDLIGRQLLADHPDRQALAEAAGLAADGAIVRAQTGPEGVRQALAGLQRLLTALDA